MRKLFTTILILAVILLPACTKKTEEADPPAQTLDPAADQAVSMMEIEPTPEPVVMNTPPPAPTPITFPVDGYISKEGVNLRSIGSTSGDIVDVLGENYPVHIVSLQDGWYRLDIEGKTAYVREDMIEIGEPPRKHNIYRATVNVDEAQLYKSPSSSDPSDRKLARDDVVKVLRTLDGYSHIVCDDFLQRYIKAEHITKIAETSDVE